MRYNSRSFAAIEDAGHCRICGEDKDAGYCQCPQDPIFGSIPASHKATQDDDLEAVIQEQRQKGYETFNDYLERTGFPADEDSYASWISEGKWLITAKPSKYGS